MIRETPLQDAVKSPRFSALQSWYGRQTALRPDGLPRVRVLLALPALLVLAGVILVALGINGSSSGAYYGQLYTGKDPALIAGTPQSIRSDEWNVGVPWSISQVQQGLPDRNETFPGGMDAELPYDLPQSTPSVIFKPHNWGYLFLDIDRATAWKWWAPGLALIAAAFVFLVIMLPRRPLLSAVLAVGFYFSPFFQWWYQTTTFWPVVWGLVTMAALLWAARSRPGWSRWVWALVVAFFTVVMAMIIYAPFIIPVVLVVLFFGLGLVIQALTSRAGVLAVTKRFLPVLVAGAVGGIITVIWLKSKSATVDAFLGTVYPGERLMPTGGGSAIAFARTVGSSFSESLANDGSFLGINSSEASTFFLLGIFLLPIAGWIVVRRVRTRAALPWISISLVAVLALFLAFMFLPGWDAIAHLLFLDRSTPDRLRIGVGVISLALLASVIRDLDDDSIATPRRWLAGATTSLFVLSQLAIAAAVYSVQGADHLWGKSPLWLVFTLVSGAAIYAIARRRFVLGSIAFLLVCVASCAFVNPVYVGVLDLRESVISKDIRTIDANDPGAWLGIGTPLTTALLVESGVEAFNGTQGAPSEDMWAMVDPQDRYEAQWNRIGSVRWTPGPGEPVVTNPAPDIISSTFDACGTFATTHVAYVLSDDQELFSPCLAEVQRVTLPTSTMTIYKITQR